MSQIIRVRPLGSLRTALGRGEVELEGTGVKVKDLLRSVQREAGESSTISPSNTLITINGIEISVLEGEETIVKAGDEVVLIPVAHGG